MMRMDTHNSEPSLDLSDREPSAWVNLWNTNYGAAGAGLGLNGGGKYTASDTD